LAQLLIEKRVTKAECDKKVAVGYAPPKRLISLLSGPRDLVLSDLVKAVDSFSRETPVEFQKKLLETRLQISD